MTIRDGEETGAERTCIVSGEKHPPEAMMRFVLSPAGEVTPDLRRKLPGRGVWSLPTAAIVAQAIKRKAFSRGFKREAAAPADLADRIDALLAADALQFLSLALKGGAVVAGAAKVEAAALAGKIDVLITASDAGSEGERLSGRFARLGRPEGAPRPTIRTFDSTQLSLALGRPFVIHAALATGATAQAFLERARRLGVYRGVSETENGPKGQENRAEGQDDQG